MAFTIENNEGVFICEDELSDICLLLNTRYTSSFTECESIEAIYTACLFQQHLGNYWVTNCALFQTSISNPTVIL